MTTGERIKQRRIELGLSQEELAKRLGNKSRTSVCTVERNKEDLTTDRIRKYAAALSCSPSYLMGWEEQPNSDTSFDDSDLTEQAMRLYELYKQAPPKIQAAVETLLTPTKSDS